MSALRVFWRWLRAVSGDDAYERYLAHHAAMHSDREPLGRRAFFRQRQEEAWRWVKRCC